MVLNSTATKATGTTRWNSTTPTATVFSVGTDATVNANGGTYVAYLFAHNDGGFGLAGTDNVISCGSYTTSALATATINLDYEPQWLLAKPASTTGNWFLLDTMRGFNLTSNSELYSNLANAEGTGASNLYPTSTGFVDPGNFGANLNIVYIAIRRGPMKTPTSGTSVLGLNARSGNATNTAITSVGFSPDLLIIKERGVGGGNGWTQDRLRGPTNPMFTNATSAESTASTGVQSFDMTGYTVGTTTGINNSGDTFIDWSFLRAPSFMDVVCWYGDPATVNHNLTVVPELIIQKNRTTTQGWGVWRPGINYGFLNTTAAFTTYTSGTVTSTTFTPLATGSGTSNYVAYLFASCSGVSKVGSYTGTGTTKQIDCGFTGGARFVLIKRTDSTGDWYVWDSARGIVASTDPYLTLNTTAAEVTTTDWVDTYSAGFELSSNAGNNVNINGASYIFLSVA